MKMKEQLMRVYIDYRQLMKSISRTSIHYRGYMNFWPISRNDTLLYIDLGFGYHHLRVRKGDMPKTAFRTRDGHCGLLVNALWFNECGRSSHGGDEYSIYARYLDKFIVVFINGILVHSKSTVGNLFSFWEPVGEWVERVRLGSNSTCTDGLFGSWVC